MPNQPPIRIRGKDKELIAKLNRAVTQKKSYLKNTYGIKAEIPENERITAFETRKEFNQYKKEMQSFLANSYTEEKQPVKNIKREISRINKIYRTEREKVKNLKVEHGQTLEYIGKFGDRRLKRFDPLPEFKLKNFKNIDEMKQYYRDLKEEFKGNFIQNEDIAYRENYMKALKNVFGDKPAFESDYLRIKNHLENMSLENYMRYYYTKNFTKLRFIYDELQARDILDTLIEEWEVK
jgi:hypothetical protein